jgi:phosphate transport system substrate-binding protein
MKRFTSISRVVFSAAFALALVACGGEKSTTGTDTARSAAPKGRVLTVKGSDTMVILGQRFAEEYMKANPGSVVQVNGGGSGTGIAALINGTVDLAQASRSIKEEERANIRKNRQSDVIETPVALDALAVFVHESNGVKELTFDQLAQLFSGKVTNWKQVGGADAPVVLYGRENSSGTYDYFKEHVLNKGEFAPRTQALAGTAAVINAVAKDANGIGYGGIAYSKGVRALAIRKDAATPGVEPKESTVKDGTYPLSRKLFFYSIATAGPEVKKYVDWCTSAEGQAVVTNVGYFPLSDAPAAPASATH